MSNVVVYSTSTCPHCVAAKEYLSSVGLQDCGGGQSLQCAMGHMGVPVILVPGEEVVGFDKQRLDDLLSLNKQKQ